MRKWVHVTVITERVIGNGVSFHNHTRGIYIGTMIFEKNNKQVESA